MSEHTLSAEPTHSLWNRELAPRLTIAPGDTVRMECLDATGGQVRQGDTAARMLEIDQTRIHAGNARGILLMAGDAVRLIETRTRRHRRARNRSGGRRWVTRTAGQDPHSHP